MVAGMSENQNGVSGNPTKPSGNMSEADKYHMAQPTGSTADYFANRVAEQNNPGGNTDKPKKLSEADQYHMAAPSGSTADYFANRVADQNKKPRHFQEQQQQQQQYSQPPAAPVGGKVLTREEKIRQLQDK